MFWSCLKAGGGTTELDARMEGACQYRGQKVLPQFKDQGVFVGLARRCQAAGALHKVLHLVQNKSCFRCLHVIAFIKLMM